MSSLKKIAALGAVCAVALVGCSAGGSGGGSNTDAAAAECTDQTFRMTYINSSPDWAAAIDKMAEVAAEGSDGRITVEGYGEGQLVSGSSQAEVSQIQQGVIEGGVMSNMILGLYADPRFNVYNMPFLFPDHTTANAVLDGEAGDLGEAYARDAGLEPLAWGVLGYRQLTNSVRPVSAPEDIEGLSIRIGGGELFEKAFDNVGANTVTMAYGELFTALQQGAVDGQENPLSLIESSSFPEVQDYLTMWNAIYDPTLWVVNPTKFSKLCEADQTVLKEAAQEGANLQRELIATGEDDLPAILEEQGMEITRAEDVDFEAFQTVMAEPLFEDLPSGVVAEDLDALSTAIETTQETEDDE